MTVSRKKFLLIIVTGAHVRLHNEDDPRHFPDETDFRKLNLVPAALASFTHAGYVAPIEKPQQDQFPWNVRFGKRQHVPGQNTDQWIHFDEPDARELLNVPDSILLIERRHAEEFICLCEHAGVNVQLYHHDDELTI